MIVRHQFMRGSILIRSGRLAEARELLRESMRAAKAVPMPHMIANVAYPLIDLALLAGDTAEAERLLADIPEFVWQQHSVGAAYHHTAQANIHRTRGEATLAERLFRQALALIPDDEGFYGAEIRRHFARFLIAQGRGREAREHVEWLLHYYRDPVAKPRFDEAQALLAECEALAG